MLVRAGYESAFDEIVRRYGLALRAYAASIVTLQRADDVTQDAFTKAFLSLRHTDKEIKLRPWLYRIVRNTALTSIRDEPEATAELHDEYLAGGQPEEIAQHREQVGRLMAGLRELPEAQRAAIVMRELEGLSHEQIAASLGLTDGAVRQSIHRARRALRDGFGLLLPLPVMRMLLDQGFAGSASAAAAGGGAGIGVKAGVATLVAASAVTTGVALNGELVPFEKPGAAHARSTAGSGQTGIALAKTEQASTAANSPGAARVANEGNGGGHDERTSNDRSHGNEGSGGRGGDRSGSSGDVASFDHSGESGSSEGPSSDHSGTSGSESDSGGSTLGSGDTGSGEPD